MTVLGGFVKKIGYCGVGRSQNRQINTLFSKEVLELREFHERFLFSYTI